MEKPNQARSMDAKRLLGELPQELRPPFGLWLDKGLDYQHVPPEWRDEFQAWKLECLEKIATSIDGKPLMKQLNSKPG